MDGDSLKQISNAEKRKSIGDTLLPSTIDRKKTKFAQRKETLRLLKSKKKDKKARRKKRNDEGAPKQLPKTIESTREPDSTILEDPAEDIVDEIQLDIETDEFSEYFQKSYEPKVLITFSEKPVKRSRILARHLCNLIPNCMRTGRKGAAIKKIVKDSIPKGFTDIIVINEDRFEPNGMLLIHLPEGPTAYFRLSNFKAPSKRQAKEVTHHRPEVILNNFNTRLGQSVGRMLAALFHYEPEFKGRRVVTFHNQRDYIFFRHHRYKFLKGIQIPGIDGVSRRCVNWGQDLHYDYNRYNAALLIRNVENTSGTYLVKDTNLKLQEDDFSCNV